MRIVMYGHAAYYPSDDEIVIPDNTTLTLYAPSGALLDKKVADALANGEQITNNDLRAVKDNFYFLSHGMGVPPDSDTELLNTFPLILKAGEKVPNFFLDHAPIPASKMTLFPIDVPNKTINVIQTISLNELLEQYKGHDLHWAACSFAKKPDSKAFGYGYGYKFQKDSLLDKHYSPPELTEKEKKRKRMERFGTVDTTTLSGRSTRPYSESNHYVTFNQRRLEKRDRTESVRHEPYPSNKY